MSQESFKANAKGNDSKLSAQAWLEVIAEARQGDESARQQINALLDPLIQFQTDRFCRRYCQQNKFNYRCTLKPPAGSAKSDALLCEWANGSYAWMLDELAGPERLERYQGKNDAGLDHYFNFVINSLPFYERWKNWRFGRRIHVPSYIEDLGKNARRVYLSLRDGVPREFLAQKLVLPEEQTADLVELIIAELNTRNRLHLLDPPKTYNFSELSTYEDEQGEDFDFGEGDGQQLDFLQREELAEAWKALSTEEQFVIEAMVVDEQDADDVLFALQEMNISIKKGVSPKESNRQQLYYFKRKTIAKLAELMQREN